MLEFTLREIWSFQVHIRQQWQGHTTTLQRWKLQHHFYTWGTSQPQEEVWRLHTNCWRMWWKILKFKEKICEHQTRSNRKWLLNRNFGPGHRSRCWRRYLSLPIELGLKFWWQSGYWRSTQNWSNRTPRGAGVQQESDIITKTSKRRLEDSLFHGIITKRYWRWRSSSCWSWNDQCPNKPWLFWAGVICRQWRRSTNLRYA